MGDDYSGWDAFFVFSIVFMLSFSILTTICIIILFFDNRLTDNSLLDIVILVSIISSLTGILGICYWLANE